jgi:hypothetical protein
MSFEKEKCKICDKTIEGNIYTNHGDRYYHNSCYESLNPTRKAANDTNTLILNEIGGKSILTNIKEPVMSKEEADNIFGGDKITKE